jgi:hypothetical protein
MKADVFRRLQRLFDEALAHPAETRIEWCQGRVDIDAALRDQLVRLLLRDQNLATASTRHPASLGTEALEHCADVIRLPQQRIPRYEVLEEIGRGGMGRVFRALQQDAVDKERSGDQDGAPRTDAGAGAEAVSGRAPAARGA